MRIIAGEYKGRKLITLPGLNTRPMTGRMRETVFNIIGPFFTGGKILDLFGGSGALSFEALSRGCDQSYIVDLNSGAIKVIKENAGNLNVSNNIVIMRSDYRKALRKFIGDNFVFDLVFLDPPYKLKVNDTIITSLLKNKMLNDNAYIVAHYFSGALKPTEFKDLTIIKNFSYSTNEVTIYQK